MQCGPTKMRTTRGKSGDELTPGYVSETPPDTTFKVLTKN